MDNFTTLYYCGVHLWNHVLFTQTSDHYLESMVSWIFFCKKVAGTKFCAAGIKPSHAASSWDKSFQLNPSQRNNRVINSVNCASPYERHFRFSQIRQRSTVLLDIVGANSTRGKTFVVVSFCSWPVVGGRVEWQGHTVISSTPVKKTIKIWPCILIIVSYV